MHVEDFLGLSREYLFNSHDESAACQRNESSDQNPEPQNTLN
jgi:hypothetical protein